MATENGVPELVFKFKPLISTEDIVRCYDILRNNRIYVPNVAQLNDPFEGVTCPPIEGIAGCSIPIVADEDHSIMLDWKENTHILALSEDCFSPQLWAYYCNDYNGMAFCFYTDSHFRRIKKVEYPNDLVKKGGDDLILSPQKHKNHFYKCLLVKELGWKYEHEWRIIKKDRPGTYYLKFEKRELAAIILGHKLNGEIRQFITSSAAGIPLFVTKPGSVSGKVHLLPYDKENKYRYDGTKPSFIDTTSKLITKIKKAKSRSRS